MDFLPVTQTIPIEREYEGWLTRGIEDYFRELSVPAQVFAVLPRYERTWPADEAIDVNGKVLGIQVKRPVLDHPAGPNDFARLKWSLAQPRHQLNLVFNHREILFCLPTFTNRDCRREALQHAVFLTPIDSTSSSVWYDNSRAHSYPNASESPRWGLVAEGFMRCSIGHQLGGQTFGDWMRSLDGRGRSESEDVDSAVAEGSLVVIAIPGPLSAI